MRAHLMGALCTSGHLGKGGIGNQIGLRQGAQAQSQRQAVALNHLERLAD